MLTRLKVSGFKNLVDVDVRFGPFTCIAGANGVGKSNLFDAIKFLSNLATMPLTEAALSIRGKNSKFSDIRNLFHRVGDNYASEMSFEVEMIVPKADIHNNSLKVKIKNVVTVYRYKLCLSHQEKSDPILTKPLTIVSESLCMVGKDDPDFQFPINHDPDWDESVILFSEKTFDTFRYYLNSKGEKTYEDSIVGYSHKQNPDHEQVRTFLTLNPSFLLNLDPQIRSKPFFSPNEWVRREMESWQNFHFEPSALRKSSKFSAPNQLDPDGAHLPKTLYSIAHKSDYPENVFCEISNKIMGFIEGAKAVEIDQDKLEEWLTLTLRYKDGKKLPAHQLSDGTLRLLALAVLELDENATGVYCIEEPENGFSPKFIRDIIQQLRDIAVDPQFPVEEGNPLRQVIINTHSPTFVRLVPEDSLIIANKRNARVNGEICTIAEFACFDETWRHPKGTENGMRSIYIGEIFAYLDPTAVNQPREDYILPDEEEDDYIEPRRMMDREELQEFIPGAQKRVEPEDRHD